MFDLKDVLDTAQEAQEQSMKNTFIFGFPEGEHDVRIVPNKYHADGKNNMIHAYVHYQGVMSETSFSPKTFGKPDPLEEWVDSVLKKGKVSTEEFKRLMQFKPKHVYLVPVVVRPKESDEKKDLSVKWMVLTGGRASDPAWKKGGQYEKIIDAMAGAFRKRLQAGDKVDVTDIEKGNDFTVTVIPKEKTQSGYKEVNFVFEQIPSPLSTDKAVVKRLLAEQPDWKMLFANPSSEEMMDALEVYMNRKDEDANEDMDEETTVSTAPTLEVSSKEADDLVAQAEAVFASKKASTPSPIPVASPTQVVGDKEDDDLPF